MPYATLLLTMIKIVLIAPFHSHRSVNRMRPAVADKPQNCACLIRSKGMFPASSLRGTNASLAGRVTRKMYEGTG